MGAVGSGQGLRDVLATASCSPHWHETANHGQRELRLAKPADTAGENEFSPPQNLIVTSASSPVENSLKEPCNTPLSNDTLYSNTNSPSDSYVKPLCDAASEKKSQCHKGVKYVSSEGDKLECGWGAFTPACLQFFNTPKGVLLFLCVASFLQGMIVNGFINTVITSIERRFDLHSYQSGLIASSYDIAACVCLTFVSYFGGNGHKPRWLGWGVLIMGVGSIVFALPHFTTSQYEVHFSEETGMCSSNHSMQCAESMSILSNYRFVFMLGQFLHGIGATPLYTLGVTYLDENVKSNYSPVYIAIFYTAAILGPAAGYLVGGMFLNIYTEIGKQIDLTPDNTLWVGAWWIGFLGAGAAALLTAIPILGYPRQLPGSQRYIIMRVSEAHQLKDGSHETASDPDFGKTVKDLPRSLLLLLKNPTFIFLCLAGATEATLIAGMSTFGPKFLESQYGLSASEAATLFGYLVVPAGGGGTFLGGFFVNKLKLRCSGIIKLCLLCTVTSLLAAFIFFIHCPNMPMAGVTQMYNRRCVSDRQKSFALGIQWIVVRTLGGIPGPIAFGSLIDLSCLVWQDQCGEQGSCYVYQNSSMSRYTLVAGIVYKVPSLASQTGYMCGTRSGFASDSPIDIQGNN
ncbi:Solute carrier organic anion transporter family member 4A1 [Chelonia mydas]|uniref:Solute carrier organic anion transporter family member n=1 Tax=Chelonia mydas TaxID=8469 RepID=M7BUV4_CHEMY|nr:Solute carrier organic anion transporter family member 4A1 [Chelonia mydas]